MATMANGRVSPESELFKAFFKSTNPGKSLKPSSVRLSFNTTLGIRDQARGRLVRNGRPGGRNFALNGTQGEVGVSLKKKKKNIFFFFFRETHFHSVTTQMQAVVTLSDTLLPLHRVSPSIKWQ